MNGKNGTNGMSGIRRRTRLARKLGLDANPLRRRTDKIATWLMAQFLVVVLVGAPLFAVAAFTWAARAGAAEQRAERSWHAVPARATIARCVSGTSVGVPVASTHSRTLRPAVRPTSTGMSPERTCPLGAVQRAGTQE